MKKTLMVVMGAIVAGCCCCKCENPMATAVSPDGLNEIRVWTDPLAYEVSRGGQVVVAKTTIGMKIDGKCICTKAATPKIASRRLSGRVETPVYKKSGVDLAGNETFVDFGAWGVRLVARDDGVAYRFETKMPGRVRVDCERAGLTIPCGAAKCSLNYGTRSGCEETVPLSCRANEIATPGDRHVYLPFAYSLGGRSVAVVESDVYDYPIWNLKRADGGCGVAFDGVFSKWPDKTYRLNWNNGEEWKEGGRKINVRTTKNHLVETDGQRTYPWRAFILADSPAKFCESDLVYALARGKAAYDFSWVKPGKVAWDWWNGWDNKGEKDGCNTATYKRFIDFASKTGVEYVILDEGWSETLNIWKFHPNVDVPEIIRYGNEKGVGIILWMAWAQIYGDEERVASHFAKLGAVGFKVDFMDRGDADVERFLWTFADACARWKMVLDYHGAHRPTGMSRAYPNVLNYEGVHGLECMKFYSSEDFMDNDVKAFFLRMTAGPMDYTPGAMDNYAVGTYPKEDTNDPNRKTRYNPGSEGTRCHQIALMTLYEAPLQMLSDSPTKYEKNMECFSFMASTPVTWTETIGLGGCPDSFAAVARRAKDGSWHVAAIGNRQARDFELDTAFLGAGEWKAEVFRDAADADVAPMHYVHETGLKVVAGEKKVFHMAPGGGLAVRFTK